ncbi:MAG: NUDIX hydrolase [Thermoplasmata archaeon]|nr:NUDIX hydrolase [Thermoplasmata archaeon]
MAGTTRRRPPTPSKGPRGVTIAYPGSPYRGRRPIVTPALVVDGILRHGPHVLLIRRRRAPWVGMWALPGGFVEIGESLEEAVVREFREETGLATSVDSLVGVYSDPQRDPRAHVVSVAYRLRGKRSTPRGGSDASEARWWPLDRLPLLAADHALMLTDEMQTRPPQSRARSPQSSTRV